MKHDINLCDDYMDIGQDVDSISAEAKYDVRIVLENEWLIQNNHILN